MAGILKRQTNNQKRIQTMEKGKLFKFTAANGVDVESVLIDKVGFNVHIRTAVTNYLCYAQNRLFLYYVEEDIYTKEVKHKFGKILVEYCILPDYDQLLENSHTSKQCNQEEEENWEDQCWEALSSIGDVSF